MVNVFTLHLVQDSLKVNQGKLIPIQFQYDFKYGVSLMNPSIYNDNGNIMACVRCVNYNMSHTEKGKYPHWSGPLQYIHPENDVRLATENFLVQFNDDLSINRYSYINMLQLHTPTWDFHGLEDGRLFKWDNKYYICGVRRDTTDNGQGRMELSELQITDNFAQEISRIRIPALGDDTSYCEKNWMPIIDDPYKYIVWANPTNIVTVLNPTNQNNVSVTNQIYREHIPQKDMIRGGSQVIPYKDYYIAIGHSVELWKPYSGEKDSSYWSYLIIWDKDFKLIKISDKFKFLNSKIEFCCGLCQHNENLLISFSDVDNVAYIFEVNAEWLINKL